MEQIRAMSHHSGIRLAEVGYLVILFAGIWLAVAQMPQFRLARARLVVAGLALAIGAVLLIIATHWGHYG